MAQAGKTYVRGASKLYCVAYSLFTVLIPFSLVLFITGSALSDYAVAFWGVTVLFFANVIYGFLQLRDRLLFLFLHLGIALFLLSRPFISVVCNRPDWWLLSSPETTMFALDALYLSMMCLLAATAVCGAIHEMNVANRARAKQALPKKLLVASGKLPNDGTRSAARTARGAMSTLGTAVGRLQYSQKVRYIRAASFICYIVCVLGALYAGSLKLAYMDGRMYTDFYLADTSSYTPWVIGTLESMLPFMMCAYLATMPRRRGAVFCLLAYVATSIPMLMIGSRSDFVIAFLFAALYFVFRAVTDKEEVWISRRLIIFCCIAAPLGIVAMGVMDYLRAGQNTDLSFTELLVDALYKQGVSFTILGRAYDVNDQVQALGFRFFSMGGLIDTITQGFIGQTFFGFTQLPTTNSYELATQGWSYAHTMSFFAHSNYLGGEGYGSSYILELFADFDYAGIAVGSFIMGCGLFALSHSLGRSWFWGMCALTAASRVFHMPRGYYDEWISYLWSTRFLLAVFALIVLSAVLYFLNKCVLAAQERKALAGGKASGTSGGPLRTLSKACRAPKASVAGAGAKAQVVPASDCTKAADCGVSAGRTTAACDSGPAKVSSIPLGDIRKMDNPSIHVLGSCKAGSCELGASSVNAYNVAILQ